MSVSPINENQNGAAFEYIVENPKMAKDPIVKKLTKPAAARSPLVDRLDNAQKRRDSHLKEKKEKAAVDPSAVVKQKEQMEEKLKENTVNRVTERIKSADTKRKSLLEEKAAKGQAEYEKAKKLAEAKKIDVEGELNKIQDKLAAATENKSKHLEAVKEKAKVDLEKAQKLREEKEKELKQQSAAQLERKLSACQLNREKLLEDEVARLKEKHEKAKQVAANKPKSTE